MTQDQKCSRSVPHVVFPRVARKLSILFEMLCPHCNSTGMQTCSTCSGRGQRYVGWEGSAERLQRCNNCVGTGKVGKCRTCEGTGQVIQQGGYFRTLCGDCMGKGVVERATGDRYPRGMIKTQNLTCPACRGSGRVQKYEVWLLPDWK